MDKLKILSCNVRGIANMLKRKQLFRYLIEKEANIIFLQETHSTKKYEKIWKAQWKGKIIFDHGTSKSKGTCILISPDTDVQIQKITRSKEGRFVNIELNWENNTVNLLNIYAPNVDNPEFFHNLLQTTLESQADIKIIGGDLNAHLNTDLDIKSNARTKGKNSTSKASELINMFMEENDWHDVWRTFNPDIFRFTWKRGRPLTMSRIDYFLVPAHVANQTSHCDIIPGINSDHSFISMEIETEHSIRGRGFWKMNNRHLRDKYYLDAVNELIDRVKIQNQHLDPALKWESMKQEIVSFSMYYGHKIASERRIKKKMLNAKIRTYEKKLACINLQSENAIKLIEKTNTKLDSIKNELNEEERIDAQGALLRSNSRWYNLGEKIRNISFS